MRLKEKGEIKDTPEYIHSLAIMPRMSSGKEMSDDGAINLSCGILDAARSDLALLYSKIYLRGKLNPKDTYEYKTLKRFYNSDWYYFLSKGLVSPKKAIKAAQIAGWNLAEKEEQKIARKESKEYV